MLTAVNREICTDDACVLSLSPPHNQQYNPIKTIKTSTEGTLNMLGLAKRVKVKLSFYFRGSAHAFITLKPPVHTGAHAADLHLGGVRRPRSAPAEGDLLGQREPHRPQGLLRRGQARRGDHDVRVRVAAGPGGARGTYLQHLRPPHASQRRPRRQQLHHPGAFFYVCNN